MKDARDPGTAEMTLTPKRGRGRPSTGQAKSAAERMREYRARNVTVNRGVLEAALPSWHDEPVAGGPESLELAALQDENAQLRQRIAAMEGQVARLQALAASPAPVRFRSLVSDARAQMANAMAEVITLNNPVVTRDLNEVVLDIVRDLSGHMGLLGSALRKMA